MNSNHKRKVIRVLVVDDSLICQELISSAINPEPDMQVVGIASSGKEALTLNAKLQPDIITMDIQMPGIDGFTTIEEIMSTQPIPILVVTSAPVLEGVDQTFRAITAGALDLVRKPELGSADMNRLVEKLRLLAGIRVVRHRKRKGRPTQSAKSPTNKSGKKIRVVAIAASTGGPKALVEMLAPLPRNFPHPILLTQHLPDGFFDGFTRWLGSEIAVHAKVAQADEPLDPGCVYVAPAKHHLNLTTTKRISLSTAPPIKNHRPSATPMFQSVAQVFGSEALGIILTGMGADGAAGLLSMRQAGATCLAQDEDSCLIYGMPRSAVEVGAVEVSLDIAGLTQAMRLTS